MARSTACPGFRKLQRRGVLQVGALSALGLSLADLFRIQAAQAAAKTAVPPPQARADAVIMLWLSGGPSHQDLFDMKPEAPAEVRGEFKPIRTNVPGIEFTELLAKTARHADKLAVVRGMHHTVGDHPAGTAYMLQGNNPNGPLKYPDLGCVVSDQIGSDCSFLPPYIMVPGNSEQAYNTTSGFMSISRAAFKTGGDDLSDPKWTVAGLQPLVSGDRGERRRRLLGHVDGPFARGTADGGVDAAVTAYEQAFSAITSPQARAAFDFSREPQGVREAYGPGHRGHSYLLGRKLIEAGVRFVTVDVRWPKSGVPVDGENLNWDHHDLIYVNGSCGSVRDKGGGEGRYGIATWPMMGSVDQAFSALLEDMHQRGLLQETLVCFVTEFGRTPIINKWGGRDHWTNAYSIVFAGAGVPGGQVIGATDRVGGEVVEGPHTPEDYAETIYRKLGIRTGLNLKGPGDRPVEFTPNGKPIEELF